MLELRQILVPYDFSSHSEAALQRAAWLAAKSGARLHILHACALPVHGITPYEVVVPTGVWDQIHASAAESLEEVRAKAAVDSGADVTGEVTDRLPGEAIQSAIDAMPADLVVMGTRGLTGLKHAVLGSVAERTLRTAPCPVLAVKEDQGDGGFSKIAVGVDFSDPGEKALDAAASWARELGAELHVVHAFDLPLTLVTPYEVAVPDMLIREAREAASTKLDGAIARARATGVTVTGQLTEVPAGPAIAEEAKRVGADLVVVGTRGHTGLKHLLLGSVAERTLRLADCPVLVIKG